MVKFSNPLRDKELRQLILTFVILFLGSCFIFWFLEFEFRGASAAQTWNFFAGSPRPAIFSIVILFLLNVIITAIVRGPYRGLGISWALAILWSYINARKMEARGTPFLPEDMVFTSTAGALTSFVSVESILRLILAIIIAVVLGFQLEKLIGFKKLPFTWTKIEIAPRLLIAVAASALLVGITVPIRVHGEPNEFHADEVEFIGGYFPRFSSIDCFYNNGTVLGFVYHMTSQEMEVPIGYNEESMNTLAMQYGANDDEHSFADADYNLVVILSESFIDPTLLKDIYSYTGGEVTPTWRRILADESIPAGYMYSPDYGGGTANIEYEVLTGLSNYFSGAYPYTDLLPKLDNLSSLASYAKDSGYETVTIHPYASTMYRRNQALPKLGIDEMYWQDSFAADEVKLEPGTEYISDESLYNKVLARLKDKDERQFVEAITMQNHMPFEGPKGEFELEGGDFDEVERLEVETYMARLHSSDAYLDDFLRALDELDERTVVLFFGDHAPGVYGRALASDGVKINTSVQLTPYFIYDSKRSQTYPNQSSEINSVKLSTSLPTTSPNCLPTQLYDYLKVEKPAILQITSDFCVEHPILARRYGYIETDEALKQYELINYDLLYGQRYFLKNL